MPPKSFQGTDGFHNCLKANIPNKMATIIFIDANPKAQNNHPLHNFE